MAFSLGGGLSAMGYSIEKSAATMLLEQQKAELDDKRVQLADSLAGARESKGRAEEHANRTAEMGTQFQNQGLLNTQQNEAALNLNDKASDNQIKVNKAELPNRLAEISAQTKGQIAAAAAAKGLEANDITMVETDDATGKKYALTKTGAKIDLGITGPNAADEKLLARAERFATITKTTLDPVTQLPTKEEVVDPEKAAGFLIRQGRKDLAEPYSTPKPTPPAGAVQMLKSNPSLRQQFEMKYGPGSASQYLSP